MTNWEAIAALEAKKREYMDCPHGASNQACCVFCISGTNPGMSQLSEGNGPACNPWEGATPEQIAAELPEPPRAWRASTLRHIANWIARQNNSVGSESLDEWQEFLRAEADRIEEAE